MADGSNAKQDASPARQRTEQRAPLNGNGFEQPSAQSSESLYSMSLLGDPRLKGRGNESVRIALMRQAQQTYGNRALQRHLSGEEQGMPTSRSAGARAVDRWYASRPEKAPVLERPTSTDAPDEADGTQVSSAPPRQPATHQAPIQAKLVVGASNDQYEQEADRVAAQVLSMPTPAASTGPASAHQAREDGEVRAEVQAKPLAASITPLSQGQSDDGVQAAPASATDSFAPAGDFESRLSATAGGGSLLPEETRAFMESRFGADFSGVRVHTDSEAAQLSREVSAHAFTQGQHIYLGEGKENLESSEGKQLLAHELTHVVQQTGVSGAGVTQAPAQRLQRVSTTGMAAPGQIAEFAQFAYDYWKNNPTKTRAQFAQDMIAKLNTKLLYSVTPVITTSGDLGALSRTKTTFAIEINITKFSSNPADNIGALTQPEVSKVVDTLYHEARHAEQVLRIAQMLTGKGMKRRKVSKKLDIPLAAVKKAKKERLDPGKAENAPLIAEAEVWEAFTGGKYAEYQENVEELDDELEVLENALDASTEADVISNIDPEVTKIESRLITFFDNKKLEIEALTDKQAYDTTVSTHISAIRQAFDDFKAEYDTQKSDSAKIDISKLEDMRYKLYEACYDAYQAYEDEADAWAVGAAAGAKFGSLTAVTPTKPPKRKRRTDPSAGPPSKKRSQSGSTSKKRHRSHSNSGPPTKKQR